MDYKAIIISPISEENREILIAELSEIGFDSFTEDLQELQAFVPLTEYQEKVVHDYLNRRSRELSFVFRIETIEDQNWNALWESAYEPVMIDGICMIRAPFHEPVPGMKYDLVIEPRMSFGTAHHETTSLMLRAVLNEDLKDKRVLDQGCGTGVLAVLAWKMGASRVDAIDIDTWAYQNALDNISGNNANGIRVILGNAQSIPEVNYDIVFANINRNILLQDMPAFAGCLANHGILLLSGFYENDLALIREKAGEWNLRFSSFTTENHWVCAKFVKS